MFDMGPYYLTALVNLVGPVQARHRLRPHHLPRAHHHQRAEVRHGDQGRGAHPRRRRARLRQRRHRHHHHHLRCLGGRPALASRSTAPRASLSVPDPNTFGGPVRVRRCGQRASGARSPLTHGYAENCRGIGVADMAIALPLRPPPPRQRRPGLPRARHHARRPRRLPDGQARRADEHLPSPGGPADEPAAGAGGRLTPAAEMNATGARRAPTCFDRARCPRRGLGLLLSAGRRAALRDVVSHRHIH